MYRLENWFTVQMYKKTGLKYNYKELKQVIMQIKKKKRIKVQVYSA